MALLRIVGALLLLMSAGCDPVASASSLAGAIADVGGACHYTKEEMLFPREDLEVLGPDECLILRTEGDAVRFVPENTACEDVEVLGRSCAALTRDAYFEIWSDDLQPAGHVTPWYYSGDECSCK